jgi:phenylacetate-CoA ligase
MDLESLYLRAPYWLQTVALNLNGYMIKKRRYGRFFSDSLARYNSSDPGQIDLIRLHDFLLKASETQFWEKRFDKYSVNINADKSDILNELKKLPVLTKSEVKLCLDEIKYSKPDLKVTSNHTSGTTGSGLIFPQSLEMEASQWAVWWRYRMAHGIKRDDWMGWFGGRSILPVNRKSPPYWHTINHLKQIFFSAHHLNDSTVKSYVQKIDDSKLRWLHGYPSQISYFAHLINEQGLKPPKNIDIITLGAENLNGYQKRIIQDVFECKIRQHYGLAEGAANISEDANGRLKPDMDFSLVEFLPLDESDPSICRIVGTNYHNIAFPLIRYDTGDLAKIEWASDGSPNILSIDGRQEDFITLTNGIKLGRLDHIFKDMIHVKEAQIIQYADLSLKFYIVKDRHYDSKDSENKLELEIKKRIGPEMKYSIEYVPKIERTASGKLRLVISAVN